MFYKVIIQKCSDPRCAGAIAFAVARYAEVAPEKVFSVISQKNICIRKKASHEEADRFKHEFEALGATVSLVRLDQFTPGQESAQAVSTPPDEDEESTGRILTENEYATRMRDRGDIFYIENNRTLNRIETVCLAVAIVAGMFMSTREIADIAPDFIEADAPQREITVTSTVIDRPSVEKQVEKPKTVSLTSRKVPKRTTSAGKGGKSGGTGNPFERVVRKGIIGLVSGQIRGKDIVNADIFSKGGFSDGIDAIIQGVGGLKSLGNGGSGRREVEGIGFGSGYGKSGFGENGPGGIGDPINSLFDGDHSGNLELKPRTASLRINKPTFARGGALTNGRSRQEIARVVQQNIVALRHAYNRRLREKPGLQGRITVKFAIDEFGNVVFCSIQESSIGDPALEDVLVLKIRRWKFGKIDKVGDITEVMYPFVFSQ